MPFRLLGSYYFDLTISIERLGPPFKSYIGFADEILPDYGILGFHGFLDQFDADFRQDYFELMPRTHMLE